MKIPVSEAAPGDLIFYAKNGQVYHVVIYPGNSRTVEAASTRSGICSHGEKLCQWYNARLLSDF